MAGCGAQAIKGRNRRRSSLPARHLLPVERLAAVAERIRLGLAGAAFTVSTRNLRDLGLGVTIEDERRFRRVYVWRDVIAPPSPTWSVIEAAAVVTGGWERLMQESDQAEREADQPDHSDQAAQPRHQCGSRTLLRNVV